MISRLRSHFGTAGLVVAIVALIAALAGGAIAATSSAHHHKKASKGLTKAQVLALIKKHAGSGPEGPAGPTGPAGTNGTNGTNGKDGTNGTDGATGPTGPTGNTGSNGTSATATAYTGSNCENASGEAGIEVTSAGSPQYVCNGEQGPAGPITSVAPPNLLMSGNIAGTYYFPENKEDRPGNESTIFLPFSFPYRLPGGLTEWIELVEGEEGYKIVFVKQENEEPNTEPGCPGTFFEPNSDPKVLCVWGFDYASSPNSHVSNVSFGFPPSPNGSPLGVTILDELPSPQNIYQEFQPGGQVNFIGTWSYRTPIS